MRPADVARVALIALALAVAVLAANRCPGLPARVDDARIEVVGPGTILVEVSGGAGSAFSARHEVGCDGLSVRVPAGTARAYARRDGAVVWPRSAALCPGAVVTFHVEPLRDVCLPAEGEFHFIADRTRPPVGPPQRLEALEAWIDVERPVVACRSDDERITRLPATSWWAFGGTEADPLVLRATEREDRFVRVGRGTIAVGRQPTVDGRAVPPQSLVAPGRLDLAAAAALRVLVETGAFPGAVIVAADTWRPVAVADAPEYTLWHPAFGVAYTTAGPDGLRDARTERGSVVFVPSAGVTMTGTAAVWPSWTGNGEVFSRPPDRGLRLAGTSVERITFRGLPPGTYRFDHDLAGGGRAPSGRLRRGAVVVGDAPAVPVVRARIEPP